MNKRYKIKKWFKDHFTKEKIVPWVLTGLIVLLVLLCVYFENKDKKQMESKTSDISLVETAENLNKSWTINQDGNIVGDNLLNTSGFNNYNNNGISVVYDNGYFTFNGTTTGESGTSMGEINLSSSIGFRGQMFYVSGTIESGSVEFTWASSDNSFYLDFSRNRLDYWSNGNVSSSINAQLISLRFYCNANVTFNNYKVQFTTSYSNVELEQWEPYGEWYSQSNYNNYGTLNYNNGRASAQNQYYYFNDKTIYYYADESPYQDRQVGYQYLTQDSYTNFTINSTDIIEDFYNEYEVNFYYGRITLNYLSKDFYANFIYPTSDVDGYVKFVYDDGSQYQVESYSLNRSFHIYDGAVTNPDKVINYIEMQFHYDKLLSIDITTSSNAVYYNNGYNVGYNNGYTNGNVDGLQVGRNNGYNEGYEVGYNNGINQDITTSGFKTLFNSILSYPINLISSVFNFEFMGINIASTIFFLISCGIVLWIIKRLWK